MKIVRTLVRIVGAVLGVVFSGLGIYWLINPIMSGTQDIFFNFSIIGLGAMFLIWSLSSRYHKVPYKQ